MARRNTQFLSVAKIASFSVSVSSALRTSTRVCVQFLKSSITQLGLKSITDGC
jgi:hypothetical protein